MTFNVGDVVRLRSGGPAMTVSAVQADHVVCAWFGTGSVLNTGTFAAVLLVLISAIGERHVPD